MKVSLAFSRTGLEEYAIKHITGTCPGNPKDFKKFILSLDDEQVRFSAEALLKIPAEDEIFLNIYEEICEKFLYTPPILTEINLKELIVQYVHFRRQDPQVQSQV